MRLAVAALACTGVISETALAAFPQDPPNDPNYAPAEDPSPTTCTSQSVNSDQHYLYSFMPRCGTSAKDPEGASGMSIDKAWSQFTTGTPDTTIAYIEGGINWQNNPKELADKVFLNKGELPAPTTPVNDGVLNAKDYADTPDSNNNGVVDPEDIIVRFSNGRDDDHNGYKDDISGWDFYDNQNDPATYDSTYHHSDNQMRQAAAETDNGIGQAGICPKCMVIPIKAGAEALDRTDDLAEAWLYASDMHADVITSVTADLGYSSFMNQAVNRSWKRGSVMVESSNDFDSTDHQGGMFHPHVLPGNGLVSNTEGLDTAPGSQALVNNLTTTYRERSGETSWGPHNMFSASTNGGSTSESTPTVSGVMALVLSWGKQAAAKGLIDHPLTNDEAIQVVRATASDITPDEGHKWPAKPGFDLQFGYGRPNVYKAMQAISAGDIPPIGWINKPAWYSLYDPTKTSKVPVTGHVAAPRSKRYRYTLQFAPGAEPTDDQFKTAGKGKGKGKRGFTGRLGTLNLNKIPRSFWEKQFALSQDKTLETSEQYTVTLRLRVTDAQGRVGEERRTIAVHHDPTLLKGYPKRIGPSGESQAQLADLQNRGRLATVFGDSDGRVHALDGKTGKELPGFPVFTKRTVVTAKHKGIDPGHEPIIASPAVGDLNGDGKLEIVATSTTGRVYIWNSRGKRLKGWPKRLATGVQTPAEPRPALDYTRLAQQGSTAPPVLYDLDGDGKLEIVQAAWDGHVYAWRPNGQSLPGWPVDVKLPDSYSTPAGYATVNDQKLDAPPAIADLDGDGKPEVVVRSQYMDISAAGVQPAPVSHVFAYHADGSPVAGWPDDVPGVIGYYGSAQEFITEGVSIPSAADVDGDGKDEIAFAPGIFSPTDLLNGDGSVRQTYGPLAPDTQALITGHPSTAVILGLLQGNLPTDSPVNFTTSGAFGNFGGGLSYTEPGSGAASVAASLLLTGSGFAINNYMRVHDANSGAARSGFPAKAQGLDFLGGPSIGDVTGDGQPDVVSGADSSAIQAYTEGGGQAPGFPKFQTGWQVYSPTIGDLNGDGRNDVVAITREGYVFAWKTQGSPKGNDEWWSFRHDEHNTGRYGVDTRPPGKLRGLKLKHGKLSFRAPGDDWYAGEVDHYAVTYAGAKSSSGPVKATGPAGSSQKLVVPDNAKAVRVVAVDEAGNRSPTARLQIH